jgi:hypothetical protein
MLCDDGCILYVKNLFTEFIYKHLIKSKDSEELINTLLNPASKGAKYSKLNFIKNIFCLFEDIVPEMGLYPDKSFLSGVFATPIKSTAKGYSDYINNLDQLQINSYNITYESDDTRLSEIIAKIRKDKPNEGFIILLLTCREYEKCDLNKRKLKEIIDVKKVLTVPQFITQAFY